MDGKLTGTELVPPLSPDVVGACDGGELSADASDAAGVPSGIEDSVF